MHDGGCGERVREIFFAQPLTIAEIFDTQIANDRPPRDSGQKRPRTQDTADKGLELLSNSPHVDRGVHREYQQRLEQRREYGH